MSFAPDYVDVAARIRAFEQKHPQGSLQPADLANPWSTVTVGDDTYVVFVAAAYRTPDDPRPGIGTAWELHPGKTSFTRHSELQNAETSAWGRAIVAVLAADAKRVATDDDIRNRTAGAPRVSAPKQTSGLSPSQQKLAAMKARGGGAAVDGRAPGAGPSPEPEFSSEPF